MKTFRIKDRPDISVSSARITGACCALRHESSSSDSGYSRFDAAQFLTPRKFDGRRRPLARAALPLSYPTSLSTCAAAEGAVRVLEWSGAYFGSGAINLTSVLRSLAYAARAGQPRSIAWLMQNVPSHEEEIAWRTVFKFALERARVEVLEMVPGEYCRKFKTRNVWKTALWTSSEMVRWWSPFADVVPNLKDFRVLASREHTGIMDEWKRHIPLLQKPFENRKRVAFISELFNSATIQDKPATLEWCLLEGFDITLLSNVDRDNSRVLACLCHKSSPKVERLLRKRYPALWFHAKLTLVSIDVARIKNISHTLPGEALNYVNMWKTHIQGYRELWLERRDLVLQSFRVAQDILGTSSIAGALASDVKALRGFPWHEVPTVGAQLLSDVLVSAR